MELPVLFHNESAESVVARTKQYQVKLHQFLVDVEDDVKVFLEHGWQVVAEGAQAVERFAELETDEVKKSEKKSDKAAASKDENKAAE